MTGGHRAANPRIAFTLALFVWKVASGGVWRDIIKVGPWGKDFWIKANELDEMRVTVFDADRETRSQVHFKFSPST